MRGGLVFDKWSIKFVPVQIWGSQGGGSGNKISIPIKFKTEEHQCPYSCAWHSVSVKLGRLIRAALD